MTAEIALMNKGGIALAADSAVTINQGQKIYNTANKLFMLSKFHPVGIMVYGNADLLGVPWEILIKIFRKKLDRKKFDRLEQYGEYFVRFINSQNQFFPETEQTKFYFHLIVKYFHSIVEEADEIINARIEVNNRISMPEVKRVYSNVISRYYNRIKKYESLPIATSDFIKLASEKYSALIEKAIKYVFQQIPLNKRTLDQLKKIALFLCYKDEFTDYRSGVVIAGYGEKDIFPVLMHYSVEGIFINSLKYKVEEIERIDSENLASIQAFAQSEMASTFMEGIDPALKRLIESYICQLLTEYPNRIIDCFCNECKETKNEFLTNLKQVGINLYKDFSKIIGQYMRDNYINPVLATVRILPRDELALAAESLVNLTSFKRRVSMDAETVGGPIDVAVISKADGLRKHYFKPELNHHFLSNYYNDENGGVENAEDVTEGV